MGIIGETQTKASERLKKISEATSNAFSSGSQKVKDYYHNSTAALITNPKYFAWAAAIEMLVLWFILYNRNPFGINTKYPALVIGIILLSGFMNLLMYVFVSDKDYFTKNNIQIDVSFTDFLSKVFFTVLAVLAALLAMYCIIYVITHIPNGAFAFNIFMYILYGVVGLAIMYFFLKPYIDAGAKKGAGSVLSLIGSFIMYAPCALIDLIDWFKYQYNITTSTVWILLGIEAVLFGLGFIVPKIITWILNMDGKHLLRYPIYLDKQTVIGKYRDLHPKKDDKSSTINIANVIKITNQSPKTVPPTYHYTYSISGWFWLNPQPPNTRPAYTKYTNILTYGDKPVLDFNGLENSLRVRCKLDDDNYATIFETQDVSFQTWNNIVINYDGGNMDVFLNGELVGSRPGIAPFMSFENIVVGEEKGLEGGISNVVYYDKILQSGEILMGYKALKNLRDPVL